MRRSCLLVLLVVLGKTVFAQDPKFSQYFASPLTLNPAMTGYFDGDYRLAINSRQQWGNIGNPYNTYSASGEMKLQDEYYYNDIFTIAVGGLLEESFNKFIKSYTYSAGISYYRYFDADHQFRFGLSPQLSYVSRRLNYNALTVASQYQDGAFNTALPNGLDLQSGHFSYLDLNLGTNFGFTSDRIAANIGYAIYHLTRPQDSFFKNNQVTLPYRHTLNAGFRYESNDLLDFNLSAHYLIQARSTDFVAGAVLGFKPHIESKLRLSFGLWNQTNEKAFIPFIGFDVDNIAIGMNYSLFTNNIATYKPRTFEVSLIIRDKNFTKFKNTCKF